MEMITSLDVFPKCTKCKVPLIPNISQHGAGNWCDQCRDKLNERFKADKSKRVNLDTANQAPPYTSTRKDHQAVDKIHSDIHSVTPLLVEWNGEVSEHFGRVAVVVGKTSRKGIRIRREK